MKKYIVRGVGELLDGLVVHTENSRSLHDLIEVNRIEQPSKLFRSFSVPVYGLWIEDRFLEEYKEHEDDLKTDNPYGQFIQDGSLNKHGISVVWSEYDKCTTVKVRHNNQSIYTNNFYGPELKLSARSFIQSIGQDPYYDMDDIVFDLNELMKGDSDDVE